MRHYHRSLSLVLFLIVSNALPVSGFRNQQKLTNSDVVRMLKAGLPPDIIIQTVSSSEPRFDVSADALIALKNDGVPDGVIQAMVARMAGNNTQQPSPGGFGEAGTMTRGATLIDGTNRAQMKYSTPDMRGGGLLGNPLSTKLKAAFNGKHASLRTTNTSPLFEVSIMADANPSDTIAIVKLDVKSDRREIETVKAGITGVKTGYPKDRAQPISIEEVPSGASGHHKPYRIRLANSLPPGEYAIIVYGAYYDFGIDSTK